MKPYYEHGGITIYQGDCRDLMDSIQAEALVSDPPYGSGLSVDFADRFARKAGSWWVNKDRSTQARHILIEGDQEPFDPTHLVSYPARAKILWGANWYAGRLPDSGGWYVWDKRCGRRDVSAADWPMSEA